MRIARLDGVRAIAILLVFLRHSFSLPLGWVGVNIFFVLSGFLITGILRRDRENVCFWKPFYIRRATRILPPMIIAFVAAALLFPIPWSRVGWYYLLFLGNIPSVLHGAQTYSLSVLWSLAVEEHFYLVWPFAVRFLTRIQLLRLLTALLVFEPILRFACVGFVSSPATLYYLTPFRLDGLAAGAILALLVEEQAARDRLRSVSGKLLLFTMPIAALIALPPAPYGGATGLLFVTLGYSLLACASFFLIAFVFLNEMSMLSIFLSNRWMTSLGLISYGFYLYHRIFIQWALEWGARTHVHHLGYFTPLYFAVTLVTSWVSFKFYERPLIKWGHKLALRFSAPANVSSRLHVLSGGTKLEGAVAPIGD